MGTARPKVVHVLFGMKIGGVQRQLERLLPILNEQGVEQEVVCFSQRGPLAEALEEKGIRCLFMPLNKKGLLPSSILTLFTFSLGLGRLKPSMLHLHGYPGNVRAAFAAKMLRLPYLLHYRNEHLPGSALETLEERLAVTGASAVCAVSHNALLSAFRRTGNVGHSPVVLTNGITVGTWRPGCKENLLKKVGLVCRIAPQKRVKIFVEASAIAAKVRRDVECIHIGGMNRKRLERLQQWIRERKTGCFTAMGELSNPRSLIEEFDVGVLVSDREGMPNVLLEYLEAGVPAVVTEIPANLEIALPGITGLTVAVGDAAALANAFCLLLDHPRMARRFSLFSRARVKRFKIELAARRTIGLYRSILKCAS